jgi:hypothetical protein
MSIFNRPDLKSGLIFFKNSIHKKQIFSEKNTNSFVFLCGANNGEKGPSARRKALIEFANKHIKQSHFFLAEKVFSNLEKHGHKSNALDIEHWLTEIADRVIIILESPSAFTELGAFSHKELREKIIVINDKKFEKENSFINLGPIKAIKDKRPKNILTYNMSPKGISDLDGIGEIFPFIIDLIPQYTKTNNKYLKDELVPSVFNKRTVQFVHDLILIFAPLTTKEIIEVLNTVFGEQSYKKLNAVLSFLEAVDFIHLCENGYYKSKKKSTFYGIDAQMEKVISRFRSFGIKSGRFA